MFVADHRVLDAVGDDEQDDEVRGRHLADLALAADPQGEDEEDVDDRRSDRDADEVRAEIGDVHRARV